MRGRIKDLAMAGDWIKVEHSLPNKPEVMKLATYLGINEMAVVGHLVLFWSWVDTNMSPECPVVNGTKSGLDRVAGRDGFVDAMQKVGWLFFEDGKVSIPNYEHHLSKSAKTRASEARKKKTQRSHRDKCPDGNGTKSGQEQGPEKRREEKSNTLTNSREANSKSSHWGNEEFRLTWAKWIDHQRADKPVSEMSEELQLYDLEKFQTQDAIDLIRFSIARRAKNLILNGDHRKNDARGSPKEKVDVSGLLEHMERVRENGGKWV